MIRLVGIALVIWGLIIQPLIAGVPIKMLNGSSNIEVAFDVDVDEHADKSQHHLNTQTTTKPPCHDEAADSQSSSDSCDNCDINCMNRGVCASTCVLSGVIVNHELAVLSEQHILTPIYANADPIDSGFLTRIYHPPQLS